MQIDPLPVCFPISELPSEDDALFESVREALESLEPPLAWEGSGFEDT